MVKKSLKQTAVMMTALFTVLMLTGFIGVMAIDYEWNNNVVNDTLFITDSNTQFTKYQNLNMPYDTYDYFGNVQHEHRSGGNFLTYNRTAVYTGNNTWAYSANVTTSTLYNSAEWLISLPNLDNWIISSIKYNVSLPGNADLAFSSAFAYPIDGIRDMDRPEPTTTSIISNANVDGQHEYNNDHALSSSESLSVYQASQNTDPALWIMVSSPAPMSAWAYSISIEIEGQKVNDSSLADTTAWIMAGSIVLNVIAIMYMTDGLDIIPKKTKDASKYRKSRFWALPLLGVGLFGIEMPSLTFDLLYFLPVCILIIASLMAYYKRITIPMAMFGVLISLGITVLFAPYQAIVLNPLVNALWYGYSWTFPAYLPILGLIHVTSLFIMGIVAVYNLYISHGKTLWL